MDMHVRAVGILHVILGALGLAVIAMAGLFFGAVVALVQPELPHVAVLASLGAIVVVPSILLATAEMVAALYLLSGSNAARPWVLVFGGLSLLNFPLGTAVGVYTLWALLRPSPGAATPPYPGVASA